MVMRILVGKNFSGSGRLWAWPPPPLSSFITRCISLIPSSQTMQSFCQNEVIFTSLSYTPFPLYAPVPVQPYPAFSPLFGMSRRQARHCRRTGTRLPVLRRLDVVGQPEHRRPRVEEDREAAPRGVSLQLPLREPADRGE